MRLQQRHYWLVLAIAVTIWIGVGVFAMAIFSDRSAAPAAIWLLLFGLFGVALAVSVFVGERSRMAQTLLIGIATLTVVAMAALQHERGRADPRATGNGEEVRPLP